MTVQLNNVQNIADSSEATLELNGAYYSTSAVVNGTTYVFVAGNDDDGISVFSIDENGQLTNVFNVTDSGPDPVMPGEAEIEGPAGLAVTVVNGQTILYVSGGFGAPEPPGAIQSFTVNNDGSLTALATVYDTDDTYLRGGHFIEIVEIDGNQFLYVTGYGGNFDSDHGLSVYSINGTTGALTSIQNIFDETSDSAVGGEQTLEIAGPATISQVTIGERTFLYVAGFDDDGLSVFEVADNGQLTFVENIADNGTLLINGLHGLQVAEVDGNFYLYAAGLIDDGISVFSIDTDGTLTNIDNISDTNALALNGAARLSTAILGQTTYLFAPAADDDGISVFQVNSNGTLTNIDNEFDFGDRELNEVFSAEVVTVNSRPFIIGTGLTDDGISVFALENDPIIIVDAGPFNVDENSPIGTPVGDVNATLGVGGVADQDLTYAIVGGNDSPDSDGTPAFAIDAETGEITVNDDGDLDFELQEEFDLTVQVTDDLTGITETTTVTVNVNDLNEGPQVTIPDGLMTDEDTPISLEGVTVSDPDDNTLTVTISGVADSVFTGTITAGVDSFSGIGTNLVTFVGTAANIQAAFDELSYTPPPNFFGQTQLDATITDNMGGDGADDALVDVADVDDSPIFLGEGIFFVDENSPEDTFVGDIDAVIGAGEGDAGISYKILDGNTSPDGDLNGAFSIDEATGVITVNDQGDLDFETTPEFMLLICATNDETGETETTTITINLNDLNEDPVVTPNNALSTPEDTGVALAGFMVEDVDGDTVALTLTDTGATFSGTVTAPVDDVTGLGSDSVTITGDVDDIELALAQIFYTPPPNFVGNAGIDFSADDGNGGTDVGSFSIGVTGESDAPIFIGEGIFSVEENSPVDTPVGDVDAILPGGEGVDTGITYKITGGNVGIDGDDTPPFTIDAATGAITVNDMDDLDFEIQPTYVLTICATNDETEETSVTTVTINVLDVNEDPVVTPNDALTTQEDMPVALVGFMVEDVDGDEVSLTLTDTGATFSGTVTAPVNSVNGLGTDTITIQGDVDDIELALAEIFYTPPADFTGEATIDFTANDGNGGTDAGSFTIDVSEESDAPIFIGEGIFFVDENSPDGTPVGDVDARIPGGEGDTGITYKIIEGNDSKDGDEIPPFSIDEDTGEIIVNDGGDLDFENMPIFVLTICATNDETGETSTATVTINLNDINEGPSINAPDDLITDQNTPVLLDGFVISDPEDDPLTVTLSFGGEGSFDGPVTTPNVTVSGLGTGVITLNGDNDDIEDALAEITFTPPAGFEGTALLSSSVSDGENVAEDPFGVDVSPAPNIPPVAQNDTFTTLLDEVLMGNVLEDNGAGEDSDPDSTDDLTVELLDGPELGSVVLNEDGSFTYTPEVASYCADTFTYQVFDEEGGVDTGTVFITVGLAVPEVPDPNIVPFDNVVTLTSGKDKERGGLGSDFIDGLAGDDRLKGNEGDDVLIGGLGDDRLNGEEGDDLLFGDEGDDKLRGHQGSDTLVGGDGDDSVDGGDGDDFLLGGNGNDTIKAGDGNDTADGGDGNDIIRGRDGDDVLFGGGGNDDVNGGHGNDVVLGGTGNDILTGGGGDDIFVFNVGDGQDMIRDFEEERDLIDFSCSDINVTTFEELLAVASQDKKNVVFDFGDGDVLTLRNTDLDDLTADMFIFPT